MSRFYARDTVIEVDLDAIAHNIQQFRAHVGTETQVMAVVKADGYGHGAVFVARAALAAGATYLAVSFVDEAIELRHAGITAPILVLSYTHAHAFSLAIQHQLTLTLYDEELIPLLQAAALAEQKTVKVHVKVDTGMGRIGLQPSDVPSFIQKVQHESQIYMEGLYMHYSSADERDKSYTWQQLHTFQDMLTEIEQYSIPLIHASNSAGAIDFPTRSFQMIRLGISLYGYYPSAEVNQQEVQLKPALRLKTKVIQCKKPPRGTGIGYGRTYIATGNERIATVPVGYADGYSRIHSNQGFALLRGQRVPIVGMVCMDHLMLDVSSIESVAVGEEVVLYGQQGESMICLEEITEPLGTIVHEVITRLNHRVPRIYLQAGKPIAISNQLRTEKILELTDSDKTC